MNCHFLENKRTNDVFDDDDIDEDDDKILLPPTKKSQVPTPILSTHNEDYKMGTSKCLSAINGTKLEFMPIHMVHMFEDNTQTKCVEVVVLLPGGVCHKREMDIDVTVAEDGNVLEIEVTWPDIMSNVNRMYSHLIPEERVLVDNVCCKKSMCSALAMHREREDHDIISVAKIPLPIQVIATKPTIRGAYDAETGSRRIHVTMRASDSGYAKKEGVAFTVVYSSVPTHSAMNPNMSYNHHPHFAKGCMEQGDIYTNTFGGRFGDGKHGGTYNHNH